MISVSRSILLLALLAGVISVAVAADKPVLTGTETRITYNLADQFDPSISGNFIVYTDMRGVDADIYYYDLSTHTEVQVTNAVGDQELSDVSGGIIVYTDLLSRDILVYSTLTGKTSDITSGTSYSSIDPAVGQGLVAWEDNRDGNIEIYARDLATGEERRVSNSPDRDVNPSVNQGVIVWQRCDSSGYCDIWAYDWNSGVTTQVTNTVDGDERNPHVYQGTVVYDALRNGDKNICAFSLQAQQERCLDLPGGQANPHISGDYVSFEDSASGVPHISLWHLPTGAVLPIPGNPQSAQFLNAIDGNRVVYNDDRDGQLDIYMYEFTVTFSQDTTPPVFAPLPAPVVEATDGPQAVVTFTVTATDDTDPNPLVTCLPASGSIFPVGATNIQCVAKDASGNSANASFVVRVVDTRPPVLALPSNVVADAIAPNGAPVTFIVSATDAVDSHPTISCVPASGSVLAIGTTSVTCTAKDFSGNASSGTFSVLVKAAADQIMDLIALVNSFNVKQGIQNSLDAKLLNADAALTAANAGDRSNVCNMLSAFINQTNAQAGSALTNDQAGQLITAASRIRSVLGCQN